MSLFILSLPLLCLALSSFHFHVFSAHFQLPSKRHGHAVAAYPVVVAACPICSRARERDARKCMCVVSDCENNRRRRRRCVHNDKYRPKNDDDSYWYCCCCAFVCPHTYVSGRPSEMEKTSHVGEFDQPCLYSTLLCRNDEPVWFKQSKQNILQTGRILLRNEQSNKKATGGGRNARFCCRLVVCLLANNNKNDDDNCRLCRDVVWIP